jgi:cystathionine gamma-synthase/cystathionine gamma-lyase/cystathionine beta-lyase
MTRRLADTEKGGVTVTEYSKRFKSLSTNVVHAGSPEPHIEGAVISPIFQSANYLMADETAYDEVRYLRLSNSPSHLTLQARLAVIESGEAALVTASGMAAISSAILAHVATGEHILTQRTLYGGTQSLLDKDGSRLGLRSTAVDAARSESWDSALEPTTRIFYVESISNPLMEVGDLEAIVAFCRRHGLVSIIDNTFATPVNFRPLELVVHSATKYLNGHSDIVAGAIVGSSERVSAAREALLHFGGSADAHSCFLFERGLKTLVLRLQRQNASAMRLAEFLAGRPEVRRVNYPGLPEDPSHEVAAGLFDGFGGMMSFYAADSVVAQRFLERLRIPVHAASLGGPESLVVRPSRSSHLGQTEEERLALGIGDDLIRVSVGIEDSDELIEDFAQALGT